MRRQWPCQIVSPQWMKRRPAARTTQDNCASPKPSAAGTGTTRKSCPSKPPAENGSHIASDATGSPLAATLAAIDASAKTVPSSLSAWRSATGSKWSGWRWVTGA